MRSPSSSATRDGSGSRGRLRGAIDVVALLLALAVGAALADLYARMSEDVLVGVPRVVDGDTLVIDDVNIRLAGLDAPERAQTCLDARENEFGCGAAATDYLTFLVGEGPVTCRGRGRDRYGRVIGQCRAGGVDLSEAMIERGWAVAFLGDLEAVEIRARERGVGLWAGSFERPDAWRKARRAALGLSPIGVAREAIAALAARLSGAPVMRAPADG